MNHKSRETKKYRIKFGKLICLIIINMKSLELQIISGLIAVDGRRSCGKIAWLLKYVYLVVFYELCSEIHDLERQQSHLDFNIFLFYAI